MPHDTGRQARPKVYECGRGRKQGGDQQSHRDGHREAGQIVVEQHPWRADGVDGQETTRDQKGHGQQEHARITAPVGGPAGDGREDESAGANREEQDEVQARAGPLRIVPSPGKQRHQADDRQGKRNRPGHQHSDPGQMRTGGPAGRAGGDHLSGRCCPRDGNVNACPAIAAGEIAHLGSLRYAVRTGRRGLHQHVTPCARTAEPSPRSLPRAAPLTRVLLSCLRLMHIRRHAQPA